MPALPRVVQKVFGSSLVPAGNVAVFGSLQAGAPAYSNDAATIQSLAGFLSGLNGAVIGNQSPAKQDLNGLFLLITQQLAYILQTGIPAWISTETYYANGFCQVDGEVYVSLTDSNTGNDPVTDTNNWQSLRNRIAPSSSIAKAWVNFNGNNGTILDSQNVSSVVRTAAGRYTITFTVAMANANYAVVGTCGAANGGSNSSPAGNNNAVSRDTITTTTQVSVWIPKPDQLFGEDADLVSVLIFGT